MPIKLDDDQKKKPFSVYAWASGLNIDPCGYGSTEANALSDLLDKIDDDIASLRETRAIAQAMLDERTAKIPTSNQPHNLHEGTPT